MEQGIRACRPGEVCFQTRRSGRSSVYLRTHRIYLPRSKPSGRHQKQSLLDSLSVTSISHLGGCHGVFLFLDGVSSQLIFSVLTLLPEPQISPAEVTNCPFSKLG